MRQSKWIKLLNVICLIIAIICLLYLGYYYSDRADSKVELPHEEIIEETSAQEPIINEPEEEEIIEEPVIQSKYESLYTENSDLCGWINIPDTGIDYPIMCTPEDPQYYLRRNFYKEDSIRGTLFIGKETTIEDKAIIIYGHMMKDHTMFGDLKKFLDEDFFNSHDSLQINTLYEDKEFEVIGVFKSWVHEVDEPGYRFYNYYGNPTEEEFNEYKEYLKENYIYSRDLDSLSYEDSIVQLVTCSYHRDNGRLIVVVKERNP